MRLTVTQSSLLAGCLFFLGCSTVPDGASKEFHLAEASLERADDDDIEDMLPETMARAESDFEEALDIYEAAKDDVKGEKRAELITASTEKANSAYQLANKAIELKATLKAWDDKIEDKEEHEKLNAELSSLRDKVATLESNTQRTASLEGKLQGPVAYFDTNETEVKDKFSGNIQSLSEMLKNNPNMQVTLIGHADKRGSDSLNSELSSKRAESVAQVLMNSGVQKDQITIEAKGAEQSTASVQNPAELQLDRRVDVFVVDRSGEVMTSGR